YYRDVSAWFLTLPAVTSLPSPPRMAAPPRKEDCMAPLSRRGFVAAAAAAAAAVDEYGQKFLDQYNKIKAAGNGYFSSAGVPYHSVETLMVEAPDHAHQSTSEAFSYWMW